MKCPTCGKIYKRQAWFKKHLLSHKGSEARQSSVSPSVSAADRADSHMSQGTPICDFNQESINIRTRLSIPPIKESTWKAHDLNLATLLDSPGSKQDIDSQVKTFQSTVYNYFVEYYPPTSTYAAHTNKENAFKLKMRRKKRELIKELRWAKSMGDKNLCHQLARALRSILKLIQGISLQIQDHQDNYHRAKHESNFDKNPFNYAKKIFSEKSGKLLLTKEQIYKHFSDTYAMPQKEVSYLDPPSMRPHNPTVEFSCNPPTIMEIEEQIKRKSVKSTPGPDGIPYIVYKKCPEVRKCLHNIYCRIWSCKKVPSVFGEAAFVLIPKKPEVTDPKDTRPIALTNTMSKIFFSVLQARMSRFMIKNEYFLSQHQKGFLPGISGCLEHNTLLAECLKDAREHERQLSVCWIDLENAFGSVQHKLLQVALKWYNFPTGIMDIIASYYKNLRFVIKNKEGFTDPLQYNVGLFQGCCLSPIAFNIIINILIDKLKSQEKKWGYRFKRDNIYSESILAFADDLAVLTRNPKQCQNLLILVDEFCLWSKGMRTKPSKCFCLCLGRRNTKFTSYDPSLFIAGQKIAPVEEAIPFKFLGRRIDFRGRTPSLDIVAESFINDINKVDQQPISNVKKAWIYDNYLTSRLTWPFLVYDFRKTLLFNLDAHVTRKLKSWLGLAQGADSSTLFRGQQCFGMNFKKPSELYKHLRVTKQQILSKSRDYLISSLPKDSLAAEMETRLKFHKSFMSGAQTNRSGLGWKKKESDKDIIKSFLRQDEENGYRVHAMTLEVQNEWLTIGEACIPPALKWRTLMYDWSPALVKFYLNAFQMSLPDQSNLVRWGKATDKTCTLCGVAVGTARHILVGCKTLLEKGYYSHRHDKVLEVIREAISLSIARARKGLTSSERLTTFVKEGQLKKAQSKPFSILANAPDWNILMDTFEKHYKIPDELAVSAYRPDILVYSWCLKKVVIVELTVPWETNIPKDHTIKSNKYYDLTNEITRNGFKTQLYAVEVGARGIPAKSLHRLLKDLGLPRSAVGTFMDRVSKTALTGSYSIWLGREGGERSAGEC